LTLWEERKLRVFENMVLRRIFEPRRDEVRGEWMGLHNEELNDLYSSPNIVWVIKSCNPSIRKQYFLFVSYNRAQKGKMFLLKTPTLQTCKT